MERRRIRLDAGGIVQGVGFRPTVYRLATRLGLGGLIRNHPGGVELEVEGPDRAVEDFVRLLPAELPRHARLRRLHRQDLEPRGEREFRIEASTGAGPPTALVLPDLATCPHCLRDVRDPSNRRHGYPFTNCTLCGPRYTIVQALPYDRASTTMRGFPLCAACREEYENPLDRRFHAQPVACPDCGPHLALWSHRGRVLAHREDALQQAAEALEQGEIVAVKGLGGFHLLVDARDEEAVRRLRTRKRREARPLAVMVPDLGWVARACRLSPREEALLTSPSAPIVLLHPRGGVAPSVAPGCPRLGVMLPYTPLHHLLMDRLGFPVVATSGNLSEEPLCTDEREALERLEGIADLFLVHDRPIARPVDDSVARVVAGEEQVLRLARGYAPLPLPLPVQPPPLLAVGGHLKGAVALTVGREVLVSQHLGDLDGVKAREHFLRTVASLSRLFAFEPEVVACDLHPDYASTRHARDLHPRAVGVQHHAAHVYAVMLEHGLAGPVLGVSWDGTGYGPDQTVWGGEFLRVEGPDWERVDHLRPFRLPGGEAAVREPRRAALGLLHELGVDPMPTFEERELRVLQQMLERRVQCPVTTSAGRLFDGVASLVGLRHVNAFEGQAAMELEAAAGDLRADAYPFEGTDWGPALRDLVQDGAPVPLRAARFHETMAAMILGVAQRVGLQNVALTGGCFQNARLTERCVDLLGRAGFRVHLARSVPPNDGGLAAGQALAAAYATRGGGAPCASPYPAACST